MLKLFQWNKSRGYAHHREPSVAEKTVCAPSRYRPYVVKMNNHYGN